MDGRLLAGVGPLIKKHVTFGPSHQLEPFEKKLSQQLENEHPEKLEKTRHNSFTRCPNSFKNTVTASPKKSVPTRRPNSFRMTDLNRLKATVDYIVAEVFNDPVIFLKFYLLIK